MACVFWGVGPEDFGAAEQLPEENKAAKEQKKAAEENKAAKEKKAVEVLLPTDEPSGKAPIVQKAEETEKATEARKNPPQRRQICLWCFCSWSVSAWRRCSLTSDRALLFQGVSAVCLVAEVAH